LCYTLPIEALRINVPHQQVNGLATYHFENLVVPGLVHAVFTRLGGVSREPFATLNVSENVGDDPAAVAENRAHIYAHMDIRAEQVVTTGQVHGNRVAWVAADDAGRTLPQTDGLVTDVPGVALLLRFADCQPILLYDPEHHAVGLVHAGWRGAAQGIARRAVETMQEAFGSHPAALLAALGPAIGPCCYTVGHDVAAAMGYALPDWSRVMEPHSDDLWRFDLSAANAQLLAAAGVQNIEQSDLCTACHKEIFFSHRGDKGLTGRFAVVTFLQERAAKVQDAPIEKSRRKPQPNECEMPKSLHPPGLPEFGEIQ
jgi:YfiH family protein